MTQRVMVGMSGGVDSSVAALLLQCEGYEVVGATMELFDEDDTASPGREGLCCSWESVERARHACEVLGVRHYVLNLTDEFRRDVIAQFVEEYRLGRTPNPCLRCNQLIKWGELLRRARGAGCDLIATGHYAIAGWTPNGRIALRRGLDRRKDQSYALYMLTQDELAHTRLPLGGLTKQQVRQMATEAGLPTAGTRESQDICFVPGGDYRVLFSDDAMQPGPIEDLRGRILGQHEGLPAYTVGQRKGLGVAAGEPLYVIRKDLPRNVLVLGTRQEAVRHVLRVERLNWVSTAAPLPGAVIEAEVEIRYRARPVPGSVRILPDSTAEVHLTPTDQIAAPGQSAVFYRGDTLLGGGVIGDA